MPKLSTVLMVRTAFVPTIKTLLMVEPVSKSEPELLAETV